MSTRAMVTTFFLLTLIGMITGIAYSIHTKDPGAATVAIFVGIPVAAVCVGLNSELE